MKVRSLSISVLFLATLFPTFAQSNVLPEKPVLFPSTGGAVTARCAEVIDEKRDEILDVAQRDIEEVSFDNTIRVLDHVLSGLDEGVVPLRVLGWVGETGDVRDAGDQCETDRVNFIFEQFSRQDLKAVFERAVSLMTPSQKRDPVIQAVVGNIKQRFLGAGAYVKGNGVRARIAEIRDELSREGIAYKEEIRDATKTAEIPAEYLREAPQVVIDDLVNQSDNEQNPHFLFPIKGSPKTRMVKLAPDERAREAALSAWVNRGGMGNLDRIQRIYDLRREYAYLLGFDSYLAFHAPQTMLKTPKAIRGFHDEFLFDLKAKRNYERDQFRYLKALETKNPDAVLLAHDVDRYQDQYLKSFFNVDEEILQTYFKVPRVIEVTMELLVDIFPPVRLEKKDNMPFARWANDDQIEYYDLYDTRKKNKDDPDKYLGGIIVDLYERPGKASSRAFAATLKRARTLPDGTNQPSLMYIAAGFERKDGTLEFRNVEKLFHEMGHCFQGNFGRAIAEKGTQREWAAGTPSGYNMAPDSFEIAAMLMQNYVWEPEVMRRYNSDLPLELAKRKAETRYVVAATYWARQMSFAAFDIWAHDTGRGGGIWNYDWLDEDETKEDVAERDLVSLEGRTSENFRKLFEIFRGYPALPESINEASLRHYVHPLYISNYYTYAHAEVHAADIWHIFKQNGVFDQETALAFLEEIVEKAGGIDQNVAIANFKKRATLDSRGFPTWQPWRDRKSLFIAINNARLPSRLDPLIHNSFSGEVTGPHE